MAERVIAEGKFLRLIDRDGWEVADRIKSRAVVAIVAITGDRRLILTEQYRPAVEKIVIDLPAGLVGDEPGGEGETREVAARRELIEETGYDAAVFRELETSPPSPGLTSELVTFFSAEGLHQVGEGGGAGSERITVHAVPLAELARFVADEKSAGALIDVKLYAGLYLFDH